MTTIRTLNGASVSVGGPLSGDEQQAALINRFACPAMLDYPQLMERVLDIPEAVADKVLEGIVDSPATLAACALVNRRWLHQCRHFLFLGSNIELDATVYDERDKLLHNILFDPTDTCSFWEHITDIEISDDYGTEETSDSSTRLISSALSRARNLKTLSLNRVWFTSLPSETIEAISSSNITSLHLASATFTSPSQLLNLLGDLKSLQSTCGLKGIRFSDRYPDTSLTLYVLHLSLRFHITVGNTLAFEDIAPVILSHTWNITNLNFEDLWFELIDITQFNRLLQQIGSSLEELVLRLGEGDEGCEFLRSFIAQLSNVSNLGPISLEHNTSLRVLSVGKIVTFGNDTSPRSSNRLTSLLTTVRSQEKFKELKGYIDYYALEPNNVDEDEENSEDEGQSEGNGGMWGEDSDDNEEVGEEPMDSDEEAPPEEDNADVDVDEDVEESDAAPDDNLKDDEQIPDQHITSHLEEENNRDWTALESYDWNSVEDALVNKERFPGIGPIFALGLTSELYDDKVMDLLRAKSLNRLSVAGTLTIDYF